MKYRSRLALSIARQAGSFASRMSATRETTASTRPAGSSGRSAVRSGVRISVRVSRSSSWGLEK
ncbi:hypothetical protein ACFV2H_42720 [Streptomyces sp. NPDC059629]|uniref:hypothetical protein n=1 Tax=Streptomyces sp. NPDC059629 TaxID=3346889 RepID=UPI00367D3D2E